MRHLSRRGLTLVELMVALAIMALLAVAAVPSFRDYLANSRLREGGNAVYAQALFAQSEAIKRNNVVRLEIDGGKVVITDRTDPENPVELRQQPLPDAVSLSDATIDFGGEGRPVDFEAASINLSLDGFSCSEVRCPGLRVDGGGAIRLCGDKNQCD